MTEREVIFANDYPEGIRPDAPRERAFEAMIEVFGTLRLNANRLLLFVLLRQAAHNADLAERAARAIQGALDGLAASGRIAFDPTVLGALHAEAGPWFQAVIAEAPRLQETIERYHAMGEAVLKASLAGDLSDDTIMDMVEFAIARINTDLEAASQVLERRKQERRAAVEEQMLEASRAVQCAVSEMAEAAHLVRLISVNARIEAAHAGAKGRAFGVISAEITDATNTTLQASMTAHAGISDLLTLIGGQADVA